MRNTGALSDPIKEDLTEVNAEETKCMYMFHHRNGGRNNLTTVNKFFENAANI
jgi:hypothetical protein